MKIRMRKGQLSVTDGPFTEAKELIGGFALMNVDSREEIVTLTKRFLEIAGDGESEIIEMFEAPADHGCTTLALAPSKEDGLIGRRDGARIGHPPRDRGGLPHRVAAADRRAGAHGARRRRSPRSWRRMRWSRRSSAGREPGVPDNPGAWLMATAKNRAIDELRRGKLLERKHEELGRDLDAERDDAVPTLDDAIDDDIGDDLLRLIFTACHPVLSTEARVALTLRLLGGLTTDEIARAFLVPEPTIAQRIVRAKRTLAEARVPFEVPRGAELAPRARVGAGGDLPDLQRGLRGDRGRRLDAPGAVRGRAAPRPHPRRAGAARARGARAGRADGDPGVARRARASGPTASRSCCSIRIARAGITS